MSLASTHFKIVNLLLETRAQFILKQFEERTHKSAKFLEQRDCAFSQGPSTMDPTTVRLFAFALTIKFGMKRRKRTASDF